MNLGAASLFFLFYNEFLHQVYVGYLMSDILIKSNQDIRHFIVRYNDVLGQILF